MLWIQMDGQTVLMLHAAMLEHIKMFCHVNQPIFPLGEESRSIIETAQMTTSRRLNPMK